MRDLSTPKEDQHGKSYSARGRRRRPQYFEDQVLRAFRQQREAGITGSVRMIGILLAPAHREIVKTEILPGLEYFHNRSGHHIDFYWPGYEGHFPNWSFRPKDFNRFIQSLQSRTSWRFSGHAELILANAFYHENVSERGSVTVDFSDAIVIDLERAIVDKAIYSVPSLFESIFQYSESQSGDDPTWGFSLHHGKGPKRSAWVDMIFSVIPLKLQDFWRATQPYRITNLNNKGSLSKRR